LPRSWLWSLIRDSSHLDDKIIEFYDLSWLKSYKRARFLSVIAISLAALTRSNWLIAYLSGIDSRGFLSLTLWAITTSSIRPGFTLWSWLALGWCGLP
jgi:hypothetical protein